MMRFLPLRTPSFWVRLRRKELSKAIRLRVSRILEHSTFHLQPKNTAVICRTDLDLGELLGEGSFAQVFHVSPKMTERQSPNTKQQQHYVLKQIHPRKLDHHKTSVKEFQQIATDMITEAAFLSRLEHAHIVELEGTSPAIHNCLCGSDSNETVDEALLNDYYFVMERVPETLDQRILIWRQQQIDSRVLLPKQCQYALQLANVICFLHQKRVIYRDLKPANVGLQQDTVKLFDFGACRELPPERPWDMNDALTSKREAANYHYYHHGSHHEQVFRMSLIGTRRYLAPEVLMGPRLYNDKCDVYGWSILVAHLLSLEEPFAGYSHSDHMNKVVWQHERPPLSDLGLPHSLEELIRHAWAEDLFVRPTMQQVVAHLRLILKNDM